MNKWLSSASFYEIYPQSFCDSNGDGIGDIQGIISKLDYIHDMGFDALWLNPCFVSPFLDAGYDVQDYYQVAPRYGTNDDLVQLFDKAHAKGIRVLLDLVPGHTSDKCSWFEQSKLPEANDMSNRYTWTNSVWDRPQPYSWVAGMADRHGCYMINFFNSQPALNYGFYEITHPDWQIPYTDPRVAGTLDAMIDVMKYWIDKGCDGFRVDMADSLVKNDDTKVATASLWRKVRAMLDEQYPHVVLVSEWCNPERAIVNAGFHADFALHHHGNITHYAFRDRDDKTGHINSYFSANCDGDISLVLDKHLQQLDVVNGKGYIALISGNHDVERLSNYLSTEELKLAYTFIYTMPSVPFMYYGDEIGMKYLPQHSYEGGYQRTGSRTPMQWDDTVNMGFGTSDKAKLYLQQDNSADAPTVKAQLADKDSLLHHVRMLNIIRKQHSQLQADGSVEIVYQGDKGYPLAYKRDDMIVAINVTRDAVTMPVAVGKQIYVVGKVAINADNIVLGAQSAVIAMQ